MNVSERACCAEIKMTYRNQKKLSTAMQVAGILSLRTRSTLHQGRSIDEALRPIEAVEPTAGAVATPEGLHISPSATDGF